MDGQCLNDRVVNVAMQPMQGKAGEVNTFEDSIFAKKDGFISCPGVEGFVQIELLCIRNCQWITISNLSMMQKVPRRTCIYDSSYSMS